MIRFLVAIGIVGALLAFAPQATLAKTMQPSAAGGLGNTRADFEKTYGKPTSDPFDDISKAIHSDMAIFHNKADNTDLSVAFSVNKDNVRRSTDRAFDILIQVPSKLSWSLDQAVAAAAKLLPKDAVALGALAPVQASVKLASDWEEQAFTSKALSKAIPDLTWWTFNDDQTQFGISIMQDASGSYSQIIVATDTQ
jgi:hypothetical protein